MTSWWPRRSAREPGARGDATVVPRARGPAAPQGGFPAEASGERLVDAAEFALDGGATREQCWERLPPVVQQRLTEIADPTLAWSAVEVAAPPDGARRPQAAVFGRRGFAAAEPTVKAAGSGDQAVYALASYQLDPATLLHAGVIHRPGAVMIQGAQAAPGADSPSAPVVDLARVRGLDTATAEVIASMPTRAQQLLVAPIAEHGEPVLRAHRFWQGSSPQVLDVVVVLASARRVTAVAGRRDIPAGHDATTAEWVLDAWHGDVVARRGL